MTDALEQFCSRIAGTDPGTTSYAVVEGTVTAVLSTAYLPQCFTKMTFSKEQCEAAYNKIAGTCPKGSGVGGGEAYIGCYAFAIQMETTG